MSKNENMTNFWSLKRIFYFPKFTTKKLCTLALLIAITIILSAISGYLRIGNFSKLTISFISVFIAAYAFGGIAGGIVAALADIISCFINPVGPFMIQLTVIEFIFGFIYGLFFYKTKQKNYITMVVSCVSIQFITNLQLKTAILSITYSTPFEVFFISRLPMCVVQFVIIFAVLLTIKPLLKTIEKII